MKIENDLYLRQLEAEGRGEETYGKDVTLIVPEEGFVVKTLEPSTGRRTYVNMCSSPKVRSPGWSACKICLALYTGRRKKNSHHIVILFPSFALLHVD